MPDSTDVVEVVQGRRAGRIQRRLPVRVEMDSRFQSRDRTCIMPVEVAVASRLRQACPVVWVVWAAAELEVDRLYTESPAVQPIQVVVVVVPLEEQIPQQAVPAWSSFACTPT